SERAVDRVPGVSRPARRPPGSRDARQRHPPPADSDLHGRRGRRRLRIAPGTRGLRFARCRRRAQRRARVPQSDPPARSGRPCSTVGREVKKMSANPPPEKPLSIPVILGTTRQGRLSEHVARFVVSELAKRPGVETELIDVRLLRFPLDDAGEQIKDPAFSEKMMKADAAVIVTPEYDHGYSGSAKHVLETNLKQYVAKAVGICGV